MRFILSRLLRIGSVFNCHVVSESKFRWFLRFVRPNCTIFSLTGGSSTTKLFRITKRRSYSSKFTKGTVLVLIYAEMIRKIPELAVMRELE